MDANKKTQIAKNYIWNTLGSVMSAGSSFILLFAVTRTLGAYAGGIFSLAYVLAQQFQTLGAYEMRPYQATDTTEKFSFFTYFVSRIITCILMLVCIIGYALFTNGITFEALLMILIATLKIFDAFEDVFHGAFQQKGRLDIAGKAFFFRVLITTVSFCITVALTYNLLFGCIVSIVISTIATVLFNVPPAKRHLDYNRKTSFKALRSLFVTCFPLFIGAFLVVYLANAPRFGIEEFYGKEIQTYYSVLFMPTLAINLLNQFAFKPLLTTLAESWVNRNFKLFSRILLRSVGVIVLAFLVLCGILYPFGTELLGWIYGIDLTPYRKELLVLLFGGALNALSVILYYGLVTMRRQGSVFIGYALSVGFAFCLVTPLISSLEIMGAALLYVASFAFLSILFSCCFFYFYFTGKNKH